MNNTDPAAAFPEPPSLFARSAGPCLKLAFRPFSRRWPAKSLTCAIVAAAVLLGAGPAWAKENHKKKGKQQQSAHRQPGRIGGGQRPNQARHAPPRPSFHNPQRAQAGRRPEVNRQNNRSREAFRAGRNRPSVQETNHNRQAALAAQAKRSRAAEIQRAQAGRQLGAAANRQPDRSRSGFQRSNLTAAQRQALARPNRGGVNNRNNQVRNRYANRNAVINKRSYVSNRAVFNQRISVVRNVYAPRLVSRAWDRGRDHYWNNHHFHWRDNAWVIIDLGDYYTPYGSAGLYRGFAEPSPEVIQQVQFALNDRGYDAGVPDGLYGPQTREAMREFQDAQGFLVTGWINQSVLNALDISG